MSSWRTYRNYEDITVSYTTKHDSKDLPLLINITCGSRAHLSLSLSCILEGHYKEENIAEYWPSATITNWASKVAPRQSLGHFVPQGFPDSGDGIEISVGTLEENIDKIVLKLASQLSQLAQHMHTEQLAQVLECQHWEVLVVLGKIANFASIERGKSSQDLPETSIVKRLL